MKLSDSFKISTPATTQLPAVMKKLAHHRPGLEENFTCVFHVRMGSEGYVYVLPLRFCRVIYNYKRGPYRMWLPTLYFLDFSIFRWLFICLFDIYYLLV